VTLLETNRARARFYGVPGFNYVMQRSTDMVNWVNVRTNGAAAGGELSMDDDFNDIEDHRAPAQAFYRMVPE
ncbi:MAG: hypothetical protein NTZ16_08765, partial [Verrucomicrobia bacterium]|nr:hypothetical protein [Verrucomicrobiota bacterium]